MRTHNGNVIFVCGAEVKSAWSCISTLQYTFMVWYSVKKTQGHSY